jgi:inorganic pyrophosphatase
MMLDKGEPDDKILAVPSDDPYYHDVFDIADLSPHYLKEVEHFFLIYKDLEGKRMEISGWKPATAAYEIIKRSLERYSETFES